jgi:hypothetical protein
MPGEDFHLSDLARFQAHPRTPAACEDLAFSFTGGCALRAYPRLHSCYRSAVPSHEYVIVLTKSSTSDRSLRRGYFLGRALCRTKKP